METVQAQFTFMGTGGSMGVPVIGCHCMACESNLSVNKRLRPSGLIQIANKNFIFDVGPDFRVQALQFKIEKIHGVLLSHAHSDHIAGIDDLRAYYFLDKSKTPCLLSEETCNELKQRYPYLFESISNPKSMTAQVDVHVLSKDFGSTFFQGVRWYFFSYLHAGIKVTGFRIGSLAYVSDIRYYSDQVIEVLSGIETLIVSVHRKKATQVHFGIEEAVEFSSLVKPNKTYFTHLSHNFEHIQAQAILPSGFELAYDGMSILFTVPKQDIQ
jgi:phosphoribosyl 1,2-cyclic phosphate phosphodiesterase